MEKHLRIAVARLWHEAHSFTPVPTRLADFQQREWQIGPSAADFYRGTATEIGAVVAMMEREGDIDVHFSLCTAAPPGGLAVEEDMQSIHDLIIDGLGSEAYDGVYVSLHGATLSERSISPDTDLLRRIRAAVGPDVPIAITCDMHACLNPDIAGLVQILSGYHSYPHVDMFETGERALSMLMQTLRNGRAYRLNMLPVPMLPLSHMMRTASGPMRELVTFAEGLTADPAIDDATYFASFTYADSPYSSGLATITAEAGTDVSASLRQMHDAMMARRDAFRAKVTPAPAGLERAEALLASGRKGPIAVIDTADNPLSGGIGDTTGLLRAFLDSGSTRRTVFSFFFDPALVERAFALGEGAPIEAQLGGRIMPEYGAPVCFDGTIERLTDGRFRNEGPMENGLAVSIGRTAVIRRDNLRIIIAETCQSVNDPGWCRLHGIDLDETDLLLVKAKNHFRASFEPLCGALIDIESPGPAPSDLHAIPFKHVPPAFLL
ncbi:M81 family metallopeptidase [Martelella sp. HB161492]|uniref:M81 family metallopeptidase n=1 Tax=Martelella sp. HB161492 TaxID=2720726 RepID=UPI0015915740|nr:M81 family metallopeptidase [Martelella sp. HB161492]